MPAYLTRQQTLDWYKNAREIAIKKIRSQGAGKVRYQCPLCEAFGDFTILPSTDISQGNFKVSYFCSECGFRIDDQGMKYFPPPPPPKHLRRPRK